MKLFTIVTATIVGLAAAIPIEERDLPDDKPDPNAIQLEQLTYGGSGCAPGSTSYVVSDAKDMVTLIFSQFEAQSGKGVQPKDNRKNCLINAKIKYPSGYQFSLFQADYDGYAGIQKGSLGQAKSTYDFSGFTPSITRTLNIPGPFFDNWHKSDVIGVESLIWSPCGKEGMLNVNSEVRIIPQGTDAANVLGVDKTTLKFTQVWHLRWRKC